MSRCFLERLFFLACAGLIGFLALSDPARVFAQDAGPGVAQDEYWRRIDEVSALLKDAQPGDAVVAEAAERLATLTAVQLPDGQIVPVDHGDLVTMLRRQSLRPEDLDAVRARLSALRQARGDLSPRAPKAAPQTWSLLDRVLSRPEFSQTPRPVQRSAFQEILDELRRWIWQWLERVGAPPGVEYGLALLGAAIVLAALAFVLRDGWQQWIAEGRGSQRGAAAERQVVSTGEALQRAQALAAGGDYRHAARFLYLATLLWLDEHRWLRYDPALTNGEVLTQVTSQPALHAALAPVVDGFERVWYGLAPLDGPGYATFSRQVERVRQTLPRAALGREQVR